MIRYERIILSTDIPTQAREHRNNPEIWKWCRQYTLISKDQQKKWLEKIEDDPTIKMFGIYNMKMISQNFPIEHEFEKAIGVCGLTSINHIHGTAEWSAYLFPEYHGKGYAKQSLIALLYHAFNDMNLNCVWGECFEHNNAVLGLAEKLGFKQEGKLRQRYFKEGKYIDTIMVSMLRSEFQKKYHLYRDKGVLVQCARCERNDACITAMAKAAGTTIIVPLTEDNLEQCNCEKIRKELEADHLRLS